jgi:RNA polymerase sigma-70 factor (ECF subfamily)
MTTSAPMAASGAPTFDERFTLLFDEHHARIFRYLDRLSGDPELAADIAQDTFVRLHRRGSLPDRPEAWLITVALNLFRNARSMESRRRRLLSVSRAAIAHSDPAPDPSRGSDANAAARLVRHALESLGERERSLLLLRAEGYSYRDIAISLDLTETSIGTLLARARRAFRDACGSEIDAHR